MIVSYASSSYKSLIVRPVLPHKLPNNIREDICWYSKNLKTEWRQCLMSSIPSRNKTFFSVPTSFCLLSLLCFIYFLSVIVEQFTQPPLHILLRTRFTHEKVMSFMSFLNKKKQDSRKTILFITETNRL